MFINHLNRVFICFFSCMLYKSKHVESFIFCVVSARAVVSLSGKSFYAMEHLYGLVATTRYTGRMEARETRIAKFDIPAAVHTV
jgi:hypothetical protein